ncbi:uncharacterized protein PGTG_04583 [Puccinia graminis f. sp. tritici CRL 75-36-700-3]|uniref:Uncharacterized protein n=1 Tax=Puccinia graminis f. sp. tritici (strain CRL 75-36-700-3 / race SCCL) TaxID=418459 RepID=E3K2Q8_PUCGT|nr:uncharacterized protein PGTG_04583 [Puccinia graminis f. sp. tritici CRL 75-36-700-3]EFP78627.2 hypothetical protein PGTG_04583 [Puccinia graminis f. sp. tritici CRL 75-36-700-3]
MEGHVLIIRNFQLGRSLSIGGWSPAQIRLCDYKCLRPIGTPFKGRWIRCLPPHLPSIHPDFPGKPIICLFIWKATGHRLFYHRDSITSFFPPNSSARTSTSCNGSHLTRYVDIFQLFDCAICLL